MRMKLKENFLYVAHRLDVVPYFPPLNTKSYRYQVKIKRKGKRLITLVGS